MAHVLYCSPSTLGTWDKQEKDGIYVWAEGMKTQHECLKKALQQKSSLAVFFCQVFVNSVAPAVIAH